jgi:hypothetical protein
MADELWDTIGKVADGAGAAGTPIRLIDRWRRRDPAKNLLREIQSEFDMRWGDQPTRSDLYEQFSRLVLGPELWPAFEAASRGDAAALERVKTYLAANLGVESRAAARDVASAIADVLARHVGRAQPDEQAAIDAATTLRHEQGQRRFDGVDETLEQILVELHEARRRPTASAFDSPSDYFTALDEPTRLLRHDLDLVGRDTELTKLTAATGNGATRVVVQPGRGGIGKTRLLRALAANLESSGRRVLFARPAAELTTEVVDGLPDGELVVVVDDAPPELTLGPLLAAAARRADLTVVVGTRPAGVEALRSAATDGRVDPRQLAVMSPLRALGEPDVLALAELAAEETSERVRRLAFATPDSPLETVVGGRLLARGELRADTDEELRQAVLARFSAEQLGRVTERVPPDIARRLATLVAALQPLDAADEQLIGLVASELSVPVSEIRRWLGDLEAAGLLLARGSLRRLTPNVLADQLLLEACVDQQWHPTGYADELWSRYGVAAAANLLANLAEVDMRLLARGTSALGGVWSSMEDQFRGADAWGREQLLEIVGRAAYPAPERALEIARIAIDDPARPSDWSLADVQIDDTSVRERLPRVLRVAGQREAHVPEIVAFLWELGRDDARPTNAHPDHPLRVLEELAAYRLPGANRDAVLELAERQLATADVDAYHHLPLELVRPLLAREGMTTRPRGRSLVLGSYTVNAEATQRWRERIRALLVDQAVGGSPRSRLAAATLFDEALRLPYGFYGQPVSQDVIDSWRDDQVELMNAIGEIEARTQDGAVRHELSRALEWHVEHDPWPEIRQRAAELLGRLEGPDEELVEAIAHPWDPRDLEAMEARDARVAARLIGAHPDPSSLADALEELVSDLAVRNSGANAGGVLAHVARASAESGRGIWAWALAHPEAALTSSAGATLDELRRSGEPIADDLRDGWSDGPQVRRAVAAYLAAGAWFKAPDPVELEILGEAVESSDAYIRQVTATTLLRLEQVDADLAARFALRTPIQDGSVDDAIFATLHSAGLERLDAEELDTLVDQFVAVDDIEYFGWQVLADLARTDLDRWTTVWRLRLEHERDDDAVSRYNAVPFQNYGIDQLGNVSPNERRATLARLLSLGEHLDWWPRRQLGRLFWRAGVPGFDDIADEPAQLDAERVTEALDAFTDWVLADGQDPSAVLEMLFELPWQLVLERPEWVKRLLESTTGDLREECMGGLHAAAFGGVYGITRLSYIEATARNLAGEFQPESPAQRQYTAVATAARRQLDRDREENEELDAGWQ